MVLLGSNYSQTTFTLWYYLSRPHLLYHRISLIIFSSPSYKNCSHFLFYNFKISQYCITLPGFHFNIFVNSMQPTFCFYQKFLETFLHFSCALTLSLFLPITVVPKVLVRLSLCGNVLFTIISREIITKWFSKICF